MASNLFDLPLELLDNIYQSLDFPSVLAMRIVRIYQNILLMFDFETWRVSVRVGSLQAKAEEKFEQHENNHFLVILKKVATEKSGKDFAFFNVMKSLLLRLARLRNTGLKWLRSIESRIHILIISEFPYGLVAQVINETCRYLRVQLWKSNSISSNWTTKVVLNLEYSLSSWWATCDFLLIHFDTPLELVLNLKLLKRLCL